MEELWPDLDLENAANRLHSTVHQLRHLLEPALTRPANSRLLRVEPDVLILADHNTIWTDIDAFEALSKQAHTTSDALHIEKLLEEAVALYAGHFLQEEPFSEWVLTRREVLQRIWIGLVLELADRRIARGALTQAIDALMPLQAADPTNEAAARRLMFLLTRLDRRSEALHVYQHLVRALQENYGITPLPETRELFETVRREDTSSTNAAPSHASDNLTIINANRSAGVQEPVIQRQPHTPQQIGRSHQSPLVGRTEELALMRHSVFAVEQHHSWHDASQQRTHTPAEADPHVHFLLLQGEAGIGKTRLAEELSRAANQRDWLVAWSHAYEQESDIPYRLWIDILRSLMVSKHSLWKYLLSKSTTKSRVTSDHLYHLCVLLPELQQMLPQDTVLPSLLSDQDQLHLWEATHHLLLSLANNEPLLIVLDDLHWADDSSLELLAYLVRRFHSQASHRIVLIGTCRDKELEPGSPLSALIANLQHEQALKVLHVQPLTAAQIGTLVAPLPQAVVQHIQTQAGGNPFFAEELARYSSNDMPATAYPLNPLQATPSYPDQLPETITAALDRRVSNLSPACQRLLSQAAILGGPFELGLLHAMELGYSEETLLHLLTEALQAGILTEAPGGSRLLYHFWHPIMMSHLYEQMSAARRRQLHRKAAQALQQLYQEHAEEGAAAITQHLLKGAGTPQLIAHYAELAGNRAYTLSAYTEAEHYYQLTIDQRTASKLLSQNNQHADRSVPEEERLHLAFLLERLGECKMIQGNYDEAYRLYTQVLESRSQQAPLSPTDYQREAQIQALLWYQMGRAQRHANNLHGVQFCNERGAQILREAGVTGGVAWACLRLQYSNKCYDEGKYAGARQAAQEAVNLFEAAQLQKPPNHTQLPSSHSTRTLQTIEGDQSELGATYEMLGIIAATIGQIPAALEHLHRALAIFEQQNNVRSTANVCNNIGGALMLTAENTSAVPFFQRSLSLAERVGDVPLEATVCINLGELADFGGQLATAEVWYRRSLLLSERLNTRSDICYACCTLAANCMHQGKVSDAFTIVRRALLIGREIQHPPLIGQALITLASLRTIILTELQSQRRLQDTEAIFSSRLKRIHVTLRHALALDGLRAEDIARAQLTQASLYLLQEQWEAAYATAQQTLAVAQEQHSIQFLVQAQRLLGIALSATWRYQEADAYFQQALHTSREYDMQLEHARTLYTVGELLLRNHTPGEASFQQGVSYLYTAHEMFSTCQAAIDLAHVERIFAEYHIIEYTE
jgi:predicted ATPase/DNA-binding SARP family transcriptional activator